MRFLVPATGAERRCRVDAFERAAAGRPGRAEIGAALRPAPGLARQGAL